MKRILIAAAVLAVSSTAAFADAFANFYDNTVTITYPDGTVVKGYVNKDKTWERHLPDGKVVKGTFEEKADGNVCFTQTDPAPAADAKPACAKVDDHKPGDSWSTKDDKGNETKYSMTAGR
jgi:hypothetical protein